MTDAPWIDGDSGNGCGVCDSCDTNHCEDCEGDGCMCECGLYDAAEEERE
jgi:hypothetical protein